MKVAVFDVDRTLVDGMCGYYYYLAVKPHISFARRLEASMKLLGYRWGLVDEREIVRLGVVLYAGMKVEFLRAKGRESFESMIKDRLLVEGLERIKKHKELGHAVFLASGSNEYVVAPVAEFVGADGFFATGAVVENGVCTRRVRLPLCFEEGELELIERKLKELGVGWDDCWVYSDNMSDLVIFERCGHPVVVNPREKLERIAIERGWTIERWKTLYGSGLATGSSFPLK